MTTIKKFLDRRDAGKCLVDPLKAYAKKSDVIILALPRGGVPVAYEIANALSLPLDIFIVRKLGVPGYPELAMGAIAFGEMILLNEEIIRDFEIAKEAIEAVITTEKKELARRNQVYRHERPFPSLTQKTIIVVDDGIATGATMRTAIKALRQEKPAHIIVAIPVIEKSLIASIAHHVDQVISILQPEQLNAVGNWYEDFSQTTDEEVHQLLSSLGVN